MSDYIIKATNIRKYFGGVKALDGVSLEIKKGEIRSWLKGISQEQAEKDLEEVEEVPTGEDIAI